jgi:phenol/toluene 2-monooxygenase (NADH) P0/A0
VQAQPSTSATPAFDVSRRYVRLREVRADGFVEFEFAIGDPELAVDLILPTDAFRNFCRDNNAVTISPLQGAAIDHARLRWSTIDPGEQGQASTPFPSTAQGGNNVG